jgi:hypothetical protein
MRISRRVLAGGLAATTVATMTSATPAAANDEAAVKQQLEALKAAMLAADKAKLETLLAPELSYGHSAGKLESKTEFIDVVSSKKTVYKALDWTDISVGMAGTNAIVRYKWESVSVADGKESNAKVGVLQVWTKADGSWKLLARQAFKV